MIKGLTFSDSSLYCWRLRLKSSAPGEREASVDILFMAIIVKTALRTAFQEKSVRNSRCGAKNRLTSFLGVEVLLHLRQQVGSTAGVTIGHEVWDLAGQPLVIQHILGGGPFGGVDSETALDKFLGRHGYIQPIFSGLELVVTSDDGLRFLGLRVLVKRRVTAEEEIGNDAHSPDVDGFVVASCMVLYQQTVRRPRETRGILLPLTL